jgi:hypothetical protein
MGIIGFVTDSTAYLHPEIIIMGVSYGDNRFCN